MCLLISWGNRRFEEENMCFLLMFKFNVWNLIRVSEEWRVGRDFKVFF